MQEYYFSKVKNIVCTYSEIVERAGEADSLYINFCRQGAKAVFWLPSMTALEVKGFSSKELLFLEDYLKRTEGLIWEVARSKAEYIAPATPYHYHKIADFSKVVFNQKEMLLASTPYYIEHNILGYQLAFQYVDELYIVLEKEGERAVLFLPPRGNARIIGESAISKDRLQILLRYFCLHRTDFLVEIYTFFMLAIKHETEKAS